MIVKIVSTEEGTCPYCGSEEIEDIGTENCDESLVITTRCLSCKRKYEDWYKISFDSKMVGTNCFIEAEVGKEVEYDD